MKKSFLKVIFTFLAASAGIGTAHAEVLLNEDFSYPGDELRGQGGWIRYTNKSEAPIQLSTKALSYKGYAEATGKSAALAGNSNSYDERVAHLFTLDEENNGITSGEVYLSALINVEEASGGHVYFLSFINGNYKAPADGESFGSELGRVFICPGSEVGTFKLGMSKNGANSTNTSSDLLLNKTHLIVLKYTFVDGTTNDIFSVWVDPADLSEESAAQMTQTNTADIGTRGMRGVALLQCGTSLKQAPKLLVDQLRVATSWAELFGGEGGGEEPEQPEQPGDAAITVSSPGIDFGYTVQGTPVEKSITVSGTGLTGDITASVSSSDFKLSSSTIAKDEAASGATVTVTYSASKAGTATGTITFSTAGAEDVTVSLKGEAQKVTTLAMSTAIINQPADNGELYRYTQKATVTYVDAAKSRVYAQDIVGGLCVDFSYMDGVPLAVGDVFNNVLCYITKEQGVPYLLAIDNVTKTGTGSKSPTEVSAAALLQDPESYIHRLVTLSDDVLFEGVSEGDTFKASAVRGTSGENPVTVLPFAGTDLIGTAIPQRAAVTGISRSLSIASIGPRGAADVVSRGETAEEALEVTYENILADNPGEVGAAKDFARCIVNATALTAPVEVYLTGANRTMFDIDVTTIPAGTGTTVVTISYKPTAIGKHTGRINFESAANPLLNTGSNFTAMAIDPATPPTVSTDASELTPFAAAVGQTQEQSIVVKTSCLPDYGSARIIEPTGAFRISSTSLLRDGDNRVTITFAPRTEGTFTDVIEISAPFGNTDTVTVTGTSGGDIPVTPEGDSPFVLD
ncbi:MAG: choice-of-anchor D domain-containing protein, partial [Muribaculaceae bacterium]|nr:choice-of-anchor D domain-containing protein [Muribaculaceae bacterium]